MKKQLLIAAVAATMGTAVIADVSITGNAKYEYFNTQMTSGADTNTANTEVNLLVAGKTGDTSVVANFELNSHGAGSSDTMDIEDLYMKTKVGDVAVKGGNWALGTTALLGEIDEGGRSNNKVDLSTTIAGVKVYAGSDSAAGTGATEVTSAMYAGVVADVSGWTLQAKKLNANDYGYGISGEIEGFGIRFENKNAKAANSDVNFGQITKTVGDFDLAVAYIDADASGLVTESDSSIFAVEMSTATAGTADTGVDSVAQISAKTSIAGNTVTVKAGTVGASAGYKDADFTQISASRSLAAGSTLALTYTDKDDRSVATSAADADKQVFEIDLSVKF
jgi:hypothetical protein